VFPVLVFAGGLGVVTVPAFATAALAKKERVACAVCHTSKVPNKDAAGLNAVGKCYEKEKSMANCSAAGKPIGAATVPAASVAPTPTRAQPAANLMATAATAQKSMPSAVPESCKNIMARHDQMMEGMKAMEAALDQKVAAMNAAAAGVAKTEAMASVITELVSQRKLREQSMMSMHSIMLEHLASHMMAGKHEGTNCPMLVSGMTSKLGGRR